MEPATVYCNARNRVVALVADLDGKGVATPVPGTPGWTVKDLVGHLTGLVADANAGQLEGAGTDAWTARHVGERRDKPLGDVLAEWDAGLPPFEAALRERPVLPFVFDIVVHEHDLRGALGISGPSDPEAVDWVLQAAIGRMGQRLTEAGTPAVRIVSDETEWTVGDGEPAATVTVPRFELFRAGFGRRSAAQVQAWDWQGDPSPYLPLLSVFGPLPPADVIE